MKNEATCKQFCRPVPTKAVLVGYYVLAFTFYDMATLNTGFAAEASTPASRQTSTTLSTHDFQPESSGNAPRAANSGTENSNAKGEGGGGAKANPSAAGKGDVEPTSDHGGTGVPTPQTGSNGAGGAGIKGGKAIEGHNSAKGTSAGSPDAQHPGTSGNPIDITITVQGTPKSKNVTLPKQTSIGLLPKLPEKRRGLAPDTLNPARNALGIRLPRQDAATPRTESAASSTANTASVGEPENKRRVFGPVPPATPKAGGAMSNPVANHSILNGTSIAHAGSATGIIGGAVKNAVGVINGTSFRR